MPSHYKLFHAPWSQASAQAISTLETFLPQLLPDTTVAVSDLLKEPELHQKYAIRVYPTLIKFDEGGVEVKRSATSLDLVNIVEFLKE